MPELNRRQILAGAAATAACAAMPAIAKAAQPESVLASGRSMLAGTSEPEAIGVNGDFYVDVISGDVWHKAAGAWKLIFDYAQSEAEVV